MPYLPVEILVSEFSSNLMSSTFLTNNARGYNTAATADLVLTVSEMEKLFKFNNYGQPSFSDDAAKLFRLYNRKQLSGTTGSTINNLPWYGYTGVYLGSTGEGFLTSDINDVGPTGSIMNGFVITSSEGGSMTAPNTGLTGDKRSNSGYVIHNVIEDEMMYTSRQLFTDPLIQTTFCSPENRNVVASELYTLGVYATEHIATVMSKDKENGNSIASNIYQTIKLNRNQLNNEGSSGISENTTSPDFGFIDGDALTWNVVVLPSQAQTQVMASARQIGARTYTFRIFCYDAEDNTNKHIMVKDRNNNPIYNSLTYYGVSGPTGATANKYTDKEGGYTGGFSGYTGSNNIKTFGAKYASYNPVLDTTEYITPPS
jgi:hypothetical protein